MLRPDRELFCRAANACLLLVATLVGAPGAFACECTTDDGVGELCAGVDTAELQRLFSADTEAFIERVSGYEKTLSDCERATTPDYNYFLGLALMMTSDYAQALVAFNTTLSLNPTPALEYRTLASIANLHFIEGNFMEAFAHGTRLSDVKYASIAVDDLARGQIVMANALVDAGLYEQAVDILDALDMAQLTSHMSCAAHYVRVQIVYKNREPDVSVRSLQPIVESCRQQGQVLYALLSLHGLSQIYALEGDHENALALLESDLPAVEELGYANLSALWFAGLSRGALLRGDIDSSIESGLAALAFENAQNALEVQLTVHDVLSKAYEIAGLDERALEHARAFHTAYVRAHDRQLAAATAFFAVQMQEAQRVQQVELLSKQASLLRLENALTSSEAENTRLYLVMVMAAAIVLAMMAYRAVGIQRKLRERVRHDILTGALSRDYFEESLRSLLTSARRRQTEVGFILFDLDRFKRVNDDFGHPVGDWLLREVVAVTRSCLPREALLGRLGGEEFGIALPDLAEKDLKQLAESVRENVAAVDTSESGHEFTVTASFGVSGTAESGCDASQLIADADAALYQAKRGGRNRVAVWEATSSAGAVAG